MYKFGSLIFLVSILLAVALVQAQNTSTTPSIAVTSPNGGQTWQLGSTQTITWTSTGINYTRLDLVDATGNIKVTNLANFEGNPGSISWLIATNIPTGSYKLKVSTCTSLSSKDNCDPSTANVYDLSDSTFSITAAPTPSGCSSDSDCAIQNPSWAGATFCDSTGLKLMQYRQHPTCQTGTCIYTTSELAAKEDCSISGKICEFTTSGGGVYACIAGTPPGPCTLNSLITTRCICGSGVYGGAYNTWSGYSSGYCCGSGSNVYQTAPGPCPTTPIYSPIPSSNQTNYTSSSPINYTTTPTSPTYTPTITPSPTYTTTPTYSPIYSTPTFTPPATIPCNTDSDCSWVITNSCPETAGANWECKSLLKPPSGYAIASTQSGVCPQILSPKPSANCGCIQNNCVPYQLGEPKEPPRKIGNTDFDTTKLLTVVIQMEQLKIKFDFLKTATTKLANYYNLTGNVNLSTKWSKASQLLEDGISRLESLKNEIKTKLENFTVEDLRDVKKEIKSVIGLIKEVVKTVL